MHFAKNNKLLDAKTTSILLILVWAYAFWPTIKESAVLYIKSGYDYQGILVIPAFFLLLASSGKQLKRANINYSAKGLFLLLACGMIWLFSTLVELSWLARIGVVSMLIAIIWMNFGKKITSILLLPLICLYLLLPIGQPLYTSLQHRFTQLLMQALLISKQAVYWDGKQIVANQHIYEMQLYLSSMKYFLLGLGIASIYAMFKTQKTLGRIAIIASFIIMPLCILFISLYTYIIINNYFGHHDFVSKHIYGFGWSMTTIGVMHASLFGFFIRDKKNIIPRDDDIDWHDHNLPRKKLFVPLIIGISVMLSIPVMAKIILQNERDKTQIALNMPQTISEWKSPKIDMPDSNIFVANYTQAKKNVRLFISKNDELQIANLQAIKSHKKTIKLAEKELSVKETILRDNKNKCQVSWKLNYVNGHLTANNTLAKALTHVYNLSSSGARTATITISTDAHADLNNARENLKDFMQDFTKQVTS